MAKQQEPERRTIHIVDLDLETGEVPIQELHVIDVPRNPTKRHSILTIDLGPAVKKLNELEAPVERPLDRPRLLRTEN
jgi:hypothetical protein